MPAPRYATQTPAEAAAAEIQRGSTKSLTHDQAAHSRAVAELVRDIRTGKVSNDERFKQRAGEIGVRDQAEVRRIEQRVSMSPFEYHVSKMPLQRAMNEVWDLMNDQERVQLASILAGKIDRAYVGGKLEEAEARRWAALVMPYYQKALAGNATSQGAAGRSPR